MVDNRALLPIRLEDLEHHPLAREVLRHAQDRGIVLRDHEMFVRLIEQVVAEHKRDVKALVVISAIIERLVMLDRLHVNNSEGRDGKAD